MNEQCQSTNACWGNAGAGSEGVVLEVLRNCFTVLNAFTFLVVSGMSSVRTSVYSEFGGYCCMSKMVCALVHKKYSSILW